MNDFSRTVKTAWFGVKSHINMLTVMCIFCVLIFPAFTLITASANNLEYYRSEYGLLLSSYGMIVSVIAGLVMPLSFYSFIYNRVSCDFYGAMPVRRSQYFWGYFSSSCLIFLVPWAATAIIHVIITENGNNLWRPFLLSLALFFVLYCSMTLAVTFSGSAPCAVLTFIIANALPATTILFPILVSGVDFTAYGKKFIDFIMAVTPVSAVFWFADEDVFIRVLPVQVIFGVLELVASFFMFKYRKTESTMALAFPKTRYYYQYGIMLLVAMFVCAVTFNSYPSPFNVYHYLDYADGMLKPYTNSHVDNDYMASAVFFTLVFVLLAFILTNMILEKNPRAAFKKIRHYFIFLGGYALFLLITVSLSINFLPKSTLPFTPKYAVFYVYGLEEIDKSEFEQLANANSDRLTSIGVVKSGSEEWGSSYHSALGDSDTVDRHYYKRFVKDAFVVTDKAKLRELEKIVGEANPNSDVIIFDSDQSRWSLCGYYTVHSADELPTEDYTDFKISFVKEGEQITSDIDEKKLDYRISDNQYSSYADIFIKENVHIRYGSAKNPSVLEKYRDYNVNLPSNRKERWGTSYKNSAVMEVA